MADDGPDRRQATSGLECGWCDGRFLPRADLALPLGDAGFVFGASVTEQLRTFDGRLFLPERHLDRMRRSLATVGFEPSIDPATAFAAAAEVASRNHPLLPAGGDLGVVVVVTAGDVAAQHGGAAGPPRTIVHSFPLAFPLWARSFSTGVALRTVGVAQVPDDCWPIAAKVRSRLHYWLADRDAGRAESGARAVLRHVDGRISETSTANVAVVHGGTILTPPETDALAGISLGFTRDLAAAAGIPWVERSLEVADLATADEILLTSTPSCILPATRFDGRAVGGGTPGPVHERLLAAWSRHVGLDIAAQARRLATAGDREERPPR